MVRAALVANPVDGEALSSWVDRTALDQEVSRRDIWRQLGFVKNDNPRPLAYGIDLSTEVMGTLQQTHGVSGEAIRAMLLRRYASSCIDFAGFDPSSNSLNRWVQNNWVLAWGSAACPLCLGNVLPVWQLRWKLPWSFTCQTHRVYLLRRCTACDEPLQSASTWDARQTTHCCTQKDTAGGPPNDGQRARRRHRNSTCNTPIHGMPAADCGDSRILEAQAVVSALIDAGDDSNTSDDFAALRSAAVLFLHVGLAELIDTCDSPVRTSFEQHCQVRDSDDVRRGPSATSGYRAYAQTPSDSLIAAAAISFAVELVFGDTRGQCESLVNTSFARPVVRERWGVLRKYWKPHDRFAEALRRAKDRQTFSISSSIDGRTPSVGHPRLGARHVPQLLWPEAADPIIDELFPTGWRDSTRRFLSVSLARMLEPELTSFERAAEALGLPAECSAQCYRLSSRMRQRNEGAVLLSHLEAVVGRLEGEQHPVDFGRRRERFAGYAEIDDADWKSICELSGITYNKSWDRSARHAAVWVWCYLCGGDFHLAPANSHECASGRRTFENRYRDTFLAQRLPRIRSELSKYAHALLSQDDSGTATVTTLPSSTA